MQILFSKSYENGINRGLGIIKGEVKKFDKKFKLFQILVGMKLI